MANTGIGFIGRRLTFFAPVSGEGLFGASTQTLLTNGDTSVNYRMLLGGRDSSLVNEDAIQAAKRVVPGNFSTFRDAEMAAARKADLYGQKYYVEFGGTIFQSAPGKFTYTFFSLGQNFQVDTGPDPAGAFVTFHNHVYIGSDLSYQPNGQDFPANVGRSLLFIDPDGNASTYFVPANYPDNTPIQTKLGNVRPQH